MSCPSAASLHPLVTQTLVDTNKYYCPFLDRGFCRESTRCNFSHDCRGSTKIPPDFCHFFLANQCLYGQECKFRHSEPIGTTSAITNSDGSSSQPTQTTLAPSSSSSSTTTIAEENGHSANTTNKFEPQSSSGESSTKFTESVAAGSDNYDGSQENSSYSDHFVSYGWQFELEDTRQMSDDLDESLKQSYDEDEYEDAYADDHIVERLDNTAAQPSSSSEQADEIVGRKFISNFRRATKLSADSSTSYEKTFAAAAATASSSSSSGTKPPAASTKAWQNRQATNEALGLTQKEEELPLCPFSSKTGECPYAEGQCTYLHGLICDLCYLACLHPFNETQRRQHRDECLLEHEREMELSFAVQRSKDKVCGICMDTVIEKKPITSSRFGILEKCNHIFCLDCIRKWRGTKSFDNRTIRACPECRVSSDFVVPSKYWVEDQEDKEKLIRDYKAALRAKPCRYFNEGKGECPFAGSCFYKHAYPDGRLAELDPPKPRRKLYGARGPTSSVTNYILWNILTSTDDDDWSEHDELESLYYDQDYGTADEDLDEFIL